MPSLKEQAQARGLAGKCRRLEKENAELRALVETLTKFNENLKRQNAALLSAASCDDVD